MRRESQEKVWTLAIGIFGLALVKRLHEEVREGRRESFDIPSPAAMPAHPEWRHAPLMISEREFVDEYGDRYGFH